MAAIVLGNGKSRSEIDINRLMAVAPVYACNAVYRTHAVTALVATDKPIATQIQESGYSAKNRFHTRRPMPNLGAQPVPKKYFGFSSGPIAVSLAAIDGHDPIYLLGFDMGPVESGKFNNVFADTEFYKASTAAPTFTGNWAKQIRTVSLDFMNSRFIRVLGPTTAEVAEFHDIPNMKTLSLAEFLDRINNPKDL